VAHQVLNNSANDLGSNVVEFVPCYILYFWNTVPHTPSPHCKTKSLCITESYPIVSNFLYHFFEWKQLAINWNPVAPLLERIKQPVWIITWSNCSWLRLNADKSTVLLVEFCLLFHFATSLFLFSKPGRHGIKRHFVKGMEPHEIYQIQTL